jgi:putative ABC transport system permease protein
MDRAALAIEYVFLFTILAGLLVLYAAIHTSQAERRRETALFRALGASRRQVLMGLLAEFLMIGVMAGCLAALTASLASYMIATHVFELIYRPNHWLWVWGVGGGGAGIALAGILGTRRLLNQSPLRALQRS